MNLLNDILTELLSNEAKYAVCPSDGGKRT